MKNATEHINEFIAAVFRRIEPTGMWTLVLRLRRWRGMSPADRYLETLSPLSVAEIESIELRHHDAH
jgi:hypothetical protein